MAEYAFHPIAEMFPLMEGGEFAALVEDIRAHGLHESIVLYEGMILDGRNRDRACRQAGVKPHYREMLFGSHAEAVAYVISANIHRRHLTAEQRREMIEKFLKSEPEKSDRQIAKTVHTSPTTIGTARKRLEKGGDVSKLDTRTDSRGRAQPAHKPKLRLTASKPASSSASTAEPEAAPTKQQGVSEPTTEPRSDKPGDQKRSRRSKAEINTENAEKSADTIRQWITSVIDLLESDTEHANKVFELLRTKYLGNLVELMRHSKAATIIAAVAAKLGAKGLAPIDRGAERFAELEMEKRTLEMKVIGLEGEINDLKERLAEREAGSKPQCIN
jgi:ParB-like chromosome segregation protein Spo0J